jgi:hypothetical protein
MVNISRHMWLFVPLYRMRSCNNRSEQRMLFVLIFSVTK